MEQDKNKLWLRGNIYSRDLTAEYDAKADGVSSCKGYSMREMKLEDLDEMIKKYPDEISTRKYNILKERLSEKGMESFTVVRDEDNAVAAYHSVSIVDTYESGLKTTLHIPEDSVYLFDAYVFKEHRGKNIHGMMVRFCLDRYRERGYKKAITYIYNTNKASSDNILGSGFHYEHSIIRIGPLGYTFDRRFSEE